MLLMCLLLMLKLQSKYSVYTEHYDVLIESIYYGEFSYQYCLPFLFSHAQDPYEGTEERTPWPSRIHHSSPSHPKSKIQPHLLLFEHAAIAA